MTILILISIYLIIGVTISYMFTEIINLGISNREKDIENHKAIESSLDIMEEAYEVLGSPSHSIFIGFIYATITIFWMPMIFMALIRKRRKRESE